MKFKSGTEEDTHLALTSGHSAIVTAEGNDIDPRFHAEAIRRGCKPIGIEIPPEAQAADGFNRAKALRDGITQMLESTEDGMFTANNKPNIKKLASIVGFNPDREEVDATWSAIQEELSGGGN